MIESQTAAPEADILSLAGKVSGPDTEMKLSDAYVRMVARDAFFWAWPIINVCNRRTTFGQLPEPLLLGGVLPVGPNNTLTMLTDYIDPAERAVACPNQDVVYGSSTIALDVSPVILQVPDFGDRFWVYQVVDSRTDSFAELGKMYGTPPGFYMLVGPHWQGEVPKGVNRVFRAQTNTGVVIPRVFRDDTPQDLQAMQPVINQIGLYPLAQFDGKMKHTAWSEVPNVHNPADSGDAGETSWVPPDKFLEMLPKALADAPPLPGEAARYGQVLAVVDAANESAHVKEVFTEAAIAAEKELVEPLFEFHSYGRQLPHYWSTIANGAHFGTDYFTRTAVAKSNIFVNKQNETKYFYQDLDQRGARLNSANRYSVTFAQDALPPVKGFWSLTLYNRQHFFEPNALKRYSIGTKNKSLHYNADGSLTINVQAQSPGAEKESNWLPAPADGMSEFSLYIRTYWPQQAVLDGSWTPPAVLKLL